MTGIDVSKHNGKIDWQKVKESGVTFAIIRAGYGKSLSQKDPTFEANYKGAKDAGLLVGAYWYSYATTGEDAKKEAEMFLSAVHGKQFDLPLYYDIEEKNQMAPANILISTFCKTLEDAGYFAGVYMSRSAFQTYTSSATRERFSLWVADWTGSQGIPGDMWQRTDSGTVMGISGHVDVNVLNRTDLPDTIKACGLNGWPKTENNTTQPEVLPIEIIMNGVRFVGSVCHDGTDTEQTRYLETVSNRKEY